MSIQNHFFIQSFSDIDNSRNPKIATFLKTYYYVKEYGEGVDRMCRELIANGVKEPKYHTDDFFLKITVPRVTEKVTVNDSKVTERVTVTEQKVAEKVTEKVIEIRNKLIHKAESRGEKLSRNRIMILELMIDNPYITKVELAEAIGISEISIWRNINAMRGKYLRRVGPDKGGFWEVITD